MPLSDQDRRRLDAIEQALVSDDPDLAAAFTSPRRVPVKAVLDGLLMVLPGPSCSSPAWSPPTRTSSPAA